MTQKANGRPEANRRPAKDTEAKGKIGPQGAKKLRRGSMLHPPHLRHRPLLRLLIFPRRIPRMSRKPRLGE